MIVRFRPEAEQEFKEARLWYRRQQLGLDSEFTRCVDEAVERIVRQPQMYPIALGSSRKTMVRRFPFQVIYEVSEHHIMILAVFHTKRDPQHWQNRC